MAAMKRAWLVSSVLAVGCFNPDTSNGDGTATDATGETSMSGATAGPSATMTTQGSQTSVEPTSASDPATTSDTNAVCGNDVVEGGEECDGGDFNDTTCTDLPSGIDNQNYTSGTLSCNDDCTIDDNGCNYSCMLTDCALICDPDTQECVECVDDSHCAPAGPEPYCVESACESCEVTGCDEPFPVCAASGLCVDAPKVVFLTSAGFSGDLGGLAGADQICNITANAAALPGMYRAWLSDNVAAVEDRFYQSTGEYVLTNDVVVAENWDDLTDGTLAAPIDVDELGNTVPANPAGVCGPDEDVWTGTFASGGAAVGQVLCANWTDSLSTGSMKGVFTESDSNWSFDCTSTDCAGPARLYCFQQ